MFQVDPKSLDRQETAHEINSADWTLGVDRGNPLREYINKDQFGLAESIESPHMIPSFDSLLDKRGRLTQ